MKSIAFALLILGISFLTFVSVYQNRVIVHQRDVIRSMVTNPYGGNDD